jgi:hypothetical protein
MISSYAAIIINFKYKTMYKKCKLVMLTSNEKACIQIGENTKKLYYVKEPNMFPNPQYLYIISDEEIKEDNWWMYIDLQGTPLFPNQDNDVVEHNDLDKLIIASTDNLNLPQPSQSFIDKYIEEYNKGNIITDVMVEYEEMIQVTRDDILDSKNIAPHFWQPKINSKDNTITIKKVKDSWNRDEVNALIRDFETKLCNNFTTYSVPYADIDTRIKFINDYLNNI